MKINLKTGEHIRLKTDNKHASFMVYVEHGIVHVTAQPAHQPSRIVVSDRHAKMEFSGQADR